MIAMTVLVTGATGFAGSHLTSRLLGEGADVRILARPTSNVSRPELAGAGVVIGDITDQESVRRAVDGAHTVYHIAAVFRKAGLPDDVYWRVNYEGTVNLLNASLTAGVQRFVYCSTIGVHTSVKDPPADETAPYEPGDVYQRSKCEAEKAVLAFHGEHGLNVTVIRPTAIYGPGDTRWLKLFRAIAKRRFLMLGNGNTLIHMVYISDLVDAFRLAAESPKAVGQVYIVGGERYVTLNELTVIIARVLGVSLRREHIPIGPVRLLSALCEDVCRPLGIEPPLFRRRVDFFVKNRAFDITKARTELGYSPKVDLQEGIRRTSQWYREQGMI